LARFDGVSDAEALCRIEPGGQIRASPPRESTGHDERLGTRSPPFLDQLTSRGLLSQILLAQDRTAEAPVIVPGVREVEVLDSTVMHSVSVYLAQAEACLAAQ
jgi:hypothetical protein